MARTKTATTAPKPARRSRKPATGKLSPREAELQAKYEHQRIVPGSWRQAGHPDRPGLGAKKVTVAVLCKACDGERIVCTSDLQWPTTCFCLVCVKDVKANRKAKAEKK